MLTCKRHALLHIIVLLFTKFQQNLIKTVGSVVRKQIQVFQFLKGSKSDKMELPLTWKLYTEGL